MDKLQKFYIDGAWVDPLSTDSMPVLNPATGERLGTVALGNAADVDRAVAAASAAFEQFPGHPGRPAGASAADQGVERGAAGGYGPGHAPGDGRANHLCARGAG